MIIAITMGACTNNNGTMVVTSHTKTDTMKVSPIITHNEIHNNKNVSIVPTTSGRAIFSSGDIKITKSEVHKNLICNPDIIKSINQMDQDLVFEVLMKGNTIYMLSDTTNWSIFDCEMKRHKIGWVVSMWELLDAHIYESTSNQWKLYENLPIHYPGVGSYSPCLYHEFVWDPMVRAIRDYFISRSSSYYEKYLICSRDDDSIPSRHE